MRKITFADIQWADVILVMEHRHRQRINAAFNDVSGSVAFEVLDIPDVYEFMDDELVAVIKASVEPIINARSST